MSNNTKRIVFGTVALLAVSALGTPEASAKQPKQVTTQVRGGWLNDAACIPTWGSPTADPDVWTFTCEGTSTWNGNLTGKTVIHATGTTNIKTGLTLGDYTESFYGTYMPDGRTGEMKSVGYFVVSEDHNFFGYGKITGGTCGFAGSSGALQFDGFLTNGGYVGTWTHPAEPVPSGPCLTVHPVG